MKYQRKINRQMIEQEKIFAISKYDKELISFV